MNDPWDRYGNDYSSTGRNELCKSDSLSREEFDLTTNRPDGIHLDRRFETQEIFVQEKFLGCCHYYLNNKYIDVNNEIQELNIARCNIYLPLRKIQDTDWYTEELHQEEPK
jgi:hypothetical protein